MLGVRSSVAPEFGSVMMKRPNGVAELPKLRPVPGTGSEDCSRSRESTSPWSV